MYYASEVSGRLLICAPHTCMGATLENYLTPRLKVLSRWGGILLITIPRHVASSFIFLKTLMNEPLFPTWSSVVQIHSLGDDFKELDNGWPESVEEQITQVRVKPQCSEYVRSMWRKNKKRNDRFTTSLPLRFKIHYPKYETKSQPKRRFDS